MSGARCVCPNKQAQLQYGNTAHQLGLYGLELVTANNARQLGAFTTGTSENETDASSNQLFESAASALEGEVTPPAPHVPTPQTPGAVPVVAGAWDFQAQPYATYVLQQGDTLSGLAATYLGSGTRWKEIWAVQSPNYKAQRTPDHIFYGDVINMPDEAAGNAHAWINEAPGKRPAKPGDKKLTPTAK